ncbi:alpha/beta fold hydrolase [Actinophytocola sp.]|uniref:alpha/beta fold hydrolase n=1 Tax=Actinophytocola sp. TaxID=1872138 RepID=UPI002ED99919
MKERANEDCSVHGGWQGGWAWDAVADNLRAAGHDVVAPTLRGLEEGDVDRAGITLHDMADDLVRQLDEQGLTDFTLVGHSGGGPVIQIVADRLRTQVRRVVFVDAWVLHNGECINDVLPRELAEAVAAMAAQTPDRTVAIPADMWQATFMQDAEESTLRDTVSRLVPSPYGWFDQPIQLARFWTDQPPSSFVFLRGDQAVPQEIYRAAAARLTNPRTVDCDGSHEAMLTHPKELAAALQVAIE